MSVVFILPLAARLDWGFGNPNKTAALIAVLIVAVWVLAYWHRRLFWLALSLCAGLGVCLVETASRGGLLAAAGGLVCLVWRAPRPWPRPYLVGSVLAVWVVIGAAVWLESTHRFAQGIGSEDKSISHRLTLWQAAPRMMIDAPGGWGVGNAGAAFMQWYQPLDRTEAYRTLVNSHLTWMVELGWMGRFLYVLGWLAVLVLCWPGKLSSGQKHPGWTMVVFGVWLAFAVSAWFSSVAESRWLWAIPVASLVAVLAWRGYARQWPHRRTWLVTTASAMALLAALVLVGVGSREQVHLRYIGGRVVVGKASAPQIWIVTNNEVLGKSYGLTLRKYFSTIGQPGFEENVSIGFVNSVEELSPSELAGKTLVVAGMVEGPQCARFKTLVPPCAKLLLLNPGFYPQDMDAGADASNKIAVIAGEFSQVPVSAWTEAIRQPTQSVAGAGNFLPRWPEVVLADSPVYR